MVDDVQVVEKCVVIVGRSQQLRMEEGGKANHGFSRRNADGGRGGEGGWLVPCWLLAWMMVSGAGLAWAGEPGAPAPAAKVYRITGVAVSGRDGTPIAKARITVAEVERGVRVTAGGDGGGPQGGGPGGGPGEGRFAGGGFGGRQGGPGRGEQGANGRDDPEAVMTDARGHFSVTVAHQGTYRVAGSARGFRQQAYEAQEGNFFAGVVLTPAAPAMDNLTLKLTADGLISGIVFDEAGDGVRNAQVRVEQVRPVEANMGQSRGVMQTAQTDDRGHYEVAPLAPGKYRVSVNARPWYAGGGAGLFREQGRVTGSASEASVDPSLDVVYAETWFPAATEAANAETIVLGGGEERQADFHLAPIPSIHLRVPRPAEAAGPGSGEIRRGIGAPMVTRTDAGGGFGYGTTVTTTSDGSWDVGGLSPGTYSVRLGVGVAGVAPGTTQVTLGGGQTVVGLAAVATSVPVTVTVEGVQDRSVRAITFVDTTTRQSFQSNMRRGGRPGDGGDEDDDENEARTVKVPPGRYEVYLAGAQGLFLTGLTAEGSEVKGRSVSVGGAMKMTVHAATGLGQVEGIARRDGKPVVGGLVLLVPAGYGREDNIAPVREDETNTDGSFTVRGVIPGEYIVVAIDKGWGVNWRDATTLMGYLGKGVAVDLKGDGVVRKEVEAVGP